MPFVSRNKENKVFGLYSRPQYKDQEFLSDNFVEVVDFRTKKANINTNEVLIQKRIAKTQRINAITALKMEGQLPVDFVDVRVKSS